MKRKEIAKRFQAILLSGALVFSSSIPVMAEQGDNKSAVNNETVALPDPETTTEGILSDSSDSNIPESILPSEETETPDVQTDSSVSSDADADYNQNDNAEESESVDIPELTETAGLSAEVIPDQMIIEDKNKDEKTITVLIKNPSKTDSADKYRLAVWSDDNGQDDLIWYEPAFSQTDDAYKAEITVSAHHSTGTYHAHLYLRKADRSMQLKGMDTFEIHPVQAEQLEVSDLDNTKGTAFITLSGVTSPSGVTEVLFPVWSANDQSDIVWYKGTKIAEGTYQITLDISKHKYHYGTYHIHTYGKNGNNTQTFLKDTSCTFTRGEKDLTAVLKGDTFTVQARNLDNNGISSYSFAIWSSNNGQDDLKWYSCKADSQGNPSFTWNPNEYGNYYIHCYAKTTAGQMIFQKGIEVNVEGPSIESMTIDADQDSGNFKITVKGLTSAKVINKVLIPVWNDKKQADIIWYQASKQADGSYTVTSNISKHGFRTGTYNAHLYVQDSSGKQTFLAKETFSINGQVDSFTAELNADQTKCTLKADGIHVPQKIKNISFAVWSLKNGQDDLKWYDAPFNAGSAETTFDIANHKTEGEYAAHLYAVSESGAKIFLCDTSFKVTSSATAEISYSDRDEVNASFKIHIKLNTDSAVKEVKVPVWCKEDQSDIVWYNAVKDADGTWSVTVLASRHAYHFGTYKIHVYPTFVNGTQVNAGISTYDLGLENYISVVNKGNGHRQVILANPSASYKEVTFPTWSSEEGQNDIVWYKAVKQSDGNWAADIYASNHDGHPGTYYVHCYGDNTFLGDVSISFDQNEMIPIGEQKVKQYVQQILNVTGRDLRSVYLWVVNNINYQKMEIPQNHPEGTTRQQYYFIYAFEHRTGNCFNYAATFYYCALELGYNAKLVEGRYLRTDGIHGVHGWVEIYINGVPYVCDPEIAWQSMRYDTYMRPYGSTPLTYFRNC